MQKDSTHPFSRVQTLTTAAMLTAVSVVIGILCKNFLTFNIYYRFTLENLPVIFSGLVFGPVVGALVGACADIVSCLCSANPALNPIITLGAACVGLCAGLVPKYIVRSPGITQIAVAELLAHLVGQVGVKSIGKIIWYGMPAWGILIGLGVSIVAGAIECALIKLIMDRLNLTAHSKKVQQ
ncbi:MAG: folate family ECF transporter S component [Oscillospiraceae bacterium]